MHLSIFCLIITLSAHNEYNLQANKEAENVDLKQK